MRLGWYVPVGILALLGGSALTASGAAGASAATGPGTGPAVVQPGGLPRDLIAPAGTYHATSANWSGYLLHGGKYRSVSAHWTEPRAHCKAGDGRESAAFWVGLDGWGSGTVEQTGTDTNCQGAKPRYSAWYEMYPAVSRGISHKVRPGDKLSASVVYNGGGKFTIKLTNHSRGWTATEHRRLASAKRASAEIIIEAPSSGGELPLADFGKVHFTGSKVDGAKIGRRHPTKITMVIGRRHLDRVSRLSHRANFSATWLHR